MAEYALVLLVTAAVTYLLTPLVRRVAVATRAMHEPRARDMHTQPTPLLGGLAMYGGLVAGLIVAGRLTSLDDPFGAGSKTAAGLLLAGGLVVVVGFIDDRWGLGAISKLAGQVAAAGILVWSGQALPWLPMPSGGEFSLEPDLSVTLTILLVVVTINAINFIDGLDGLAAGIVAVAALSFLFYSYTLIKTIGSTSQSLPAVSSALLAGMCLGFLPHNFFPARVFMGDIGAMLLGLMLAYGPISSTASLDPALLTNYAANHALNRFPTFLPLLVPAAIFVIPYTDLMFAIVRRIRAGRPVMAPDRQHLHHRLLNIGHSYRQSVLIMYLWAALFSVTVVSLSVVRTRLVVLEAATVIAILALLPATMPRLRPWASSRGVRRPVSAPAHAVALPPGTAGARRARPAGADVTRPRRSAPGAPPLSSSVTRPRGPALQPPPPSAAAAPPGPLSNGPPPAVDPFPAEVPWLPAGGYPGEESRDLGEALPRAGRLPGAEPAYPAGPRDPYPGPAGLPPAGPRDPYPGPAGLPPADPRDTFPGPGPSRRSAQGYLPAGASFPGPDPFAGPLADAGAPGAADAPDPLPQARHREIRPWLGPRPGPLVTRLYLAFALTGRSPASHRPVTGQSRARRGPVAGGSGGRSRAGWRVPGLAPARRRPRDGHTFALKR
jgi:UDP-GlcNAc:undecaprenyl-phosphate/decaprenyl-phosphate GlcNAc-1-phosphate transferase